MARYTGPNNKKARRLSFSILENGKDIAKRPYGPGQHGKDRKRKPSNYSVQLAEKQKARFMYGISEKQFKKLVNDSAKMKGVHGENLLILLESRLDNVVYRAGFGVSRAQARQLVNHGHFEVNGQKVDIPSYLIKAGDVISVRENKLDNKTIKENVEANKTRPIPEWLEKDNNKLQVKVLRLATREEVDIPVEEHLIVELYSR